MNLLQERIGPISLIEPESSLDGSSPKAEPATCITMQQILEFQLGRRRLCFDDLAFSSGNPAVTFHVNTNAGDHVSLSVIQGEADFHRLAGVVFQSS